MSLDTRVSSMAQQYVRATHGAAPPPWRDSRVCQLPPRRALGPSDLRTQVRTQSTAGPGPSSPARQHPTALQRQHPPAFGHQTQPAPHSPNGPAAQQSKQLVTHLRGVPRPNQHHATQPQWPSMQSSRAAPHRTPGAAPTCVGSPDPINAT